MERFWLPVLGPTAILALRHFDERLAVAPDGIDVDVDDLAGTVGLGDARGHHSPARRTLRRLAGFDAAVVGLSDLRVRSHLSELPNRHRSRLPESLRPAHLVALERHQTMLAQLTRTAQPEQAAGLSREMSDLIARSERRTLPSTSRPPSCVRLGPLQSWRAVPGGALIELRRADATGIACDAARNLAIARELDAVPGVVLQRVPPLHRERQARESFRAGKGGHDDGLVFCSELGTPLDPSNVRRVFARVAKTSGVEPTGAFPYLLRQRRLPAVGRGRADRRGGGPAG